MNKKYLLILSIFVVIIAVSYTYLSSKNPNKTLIDNIPLLPNKQPSPAVPIVTPGKIIPIPQTNINKISDTLDSDVSFAEIEKLTPLLPIYIKDFPTSVGIKTTINFYISPNDTGSMLRIEIFGPNFNNPDPKGKDAIAFKESFLNLKNTFSLRKIDLHKIQIVYGNRQYIQDTATSWVKEFKLLD